MELISFKQLNLFEKEIYFQENSNNELIYRHFKQINSIININVFKNELFNLLKINIINKNNGLKGNKVETFLLQQLQNSNKFKDLNCNQAIIETITNRLADFTIGNIPFQIKTMILTNSQIQFGFYRDSNFPNTLEKQILSHNSKITNTIFLFYYLKERVILSYFHFQHEFEVIETSINKNGTVFNFELSDYFNLSFVRKVNIMKLNFNKSHPIHKALKKIKNKKN